MVKIDIDKEQKNIRMESTKKMEKIQIYPSKQQHNTFNNKIKPKLIMSPLTTMPSAKKLMIAANGIPMKPTTIMNAQTANENNVSVKKEANNVKLPTETINKENSTTSAMTTTLNTNNNNKNNSAAATTVVKIIPSPMNDKQQLPLVGTETTQQQKAVSNNVENEKSKGTAGYRSEKQKITLGDVHPYITCFLCKGYLIEATTIVECLHTYCHSCLMMHLCREKCCPQCDMSINKSKTNIK